LQSLTDHRGPVHRQCSHRCQRRREIERGKPLFRFHIYNDVETIDHGGKQFPNLGAACQHAIKGARDLMCDGVRTGEINPSDWIEVEDENANVTRVSFGDALNVRTQRRRILGVSSR